ncbi:MAG: tetratricopeptide repeat protein [Patescibacteria group bacterium]
MLWWLIPIFLMIASLSVIIFIVARKLPQLGMIDVDSHPKEKARKTKEKILLERVERIQSKNFKKLAKVGAGVFDSVSKKGRRSVQKLYALEQYYEKIKKGSQKSGATTDSALVKKLINEAQELIKQEEYVLAEKKYIEVISHNSKCVEAYEDLGNLYIRTKQYAQARETLSFTLRLSPDDASVHMSMAELEMLEGNPKAAVEQARIAVQKRDHNPKYIDMYIETAFNAKMTGEIMRGIGMLKRANPDNQKIEQFEKRLDELATN